MSISVAYRSFRCRLLIAPVLVGLALSSSALGSVPSSASPLEPLRPEADQSKANVLIARQLLAGHFRKMNIDKELSAKVFDSYLEKLDTQRLYFTAADIAEFDPYRYQLDVALKSGQLDPAFQMYNRYQQRLAERLEYTLSLLDKGIPALNFSQDESIELERKEAPWAVDTAELDDLWRKRLKNAVLGMKIAGKSDDEIQKALRRRYENQLNRVYQLRSEDAFQTYMNGFTEIWDPHTNYFSPRISENFNINMSLSLEGIGAVLQSDDEYTKVLRLVPGGPAFRQGQLGASDRIIGVGQGADGEIIDVIGWRLDEVVDLIRGAKDTVVRLKVIGGKATDESKAKIIAIVRDQVKLEEQAARSDVIEIPVGEQTQRIGVIHIPTFYADFEAWRRGDPNYRSTTRDVKRLIAELQTKNIEGLIIDLRDNGGGSLEEANELVGLFIRKGPTVQIRSANNDIFVKNDPDPEMVYNGPLTVLVNRMSASASEIFAGAIQDYGRGLIVGSQTFGKGTVQAVRDLNHGQLKITQSKFYRISGASTQHMGVLPNIDMPTLIDKTEIGEDSLPNALPWDQIAAVPHDVYFKFDGQLEELNRRHQKRTSTNPEFNLVNREAALLDEQRAVKSMSLNEAKRRDYQQSVESRQLDIVNAKRALKGDAPYKTFHEFEDAQEVEAAKDEKRDLKDFVVIETGYVMVDLLELNRDVAAAK